MNQPTLFLLVGFPGSGKTTTSKAIHELFGSEHIWADQERKRMFGTPTHNQAESDQLYAALNEHTEQLLRSGKSVVFDTNFSFKRDRDHLRSIAARSGALTRLLWVRVDTQVARDRATRASHADRNGYDNPMEVAAFDKIVSHLEPPTDDENPIILDGTRITPDYIRRQLGLTS
jgi:predicted kinase